MANTVRSLSELIALLANNTVGNISEQDIRDLLVSVKSGYGAYEDVATKTTPLSAGADTALKILNDAQGSNTNEDNLPFGVSTPYALWNPSLNHVPLNSLTLHDQVYIRLDGNLTTTANNTGSFVSLYFYDDTDTYVFQLNKHLPSFKTSGTISISETLPFYVGTAIENGFVEIYIQADEAIQFEVGGVFVSIPR